MSSQKYDLHIHSVHSDGVFSPELLVDKACEKKLNGISITDHDSVEAYSDPSLFKKKSDIEIIKGIEISCKFENREIHLIGLFIDVSNKLLLEYCDYAKKMRFQRAERIIDCLQNNKISISIEDVLNEAGKSPLSRVHIAGALVKKKIVKNYYDAFEKFLNDNSPFAIKKNLADIKDALDIIKSANGISFIAHPYNLNFETINKIIELKTDGIEAVHPKINATKTKKLIYFAKEKNLLVSGGSDFHGFFSVDNKYFGNYYITENEICKMKIKAESK